MKKLYKSEFDQILTGIIAGIGEYFDVDPTVLRVGFVILVLISGIFPGIIAYIIAYFIIPEKPHGVSTLVTPPPMKTAETVQEQKIETKEESTSPVVTPEVKIETSPYRPNIMEESVVTVEDETIPPKPEITGTETNLTEEVTSSATHREDENNRDESKNQTLL